MRAGADPEVIAAETGWPVDKVMRYAGPPLAERGYIADQARATEIRRSGGSVTLDDSVALVVAPTGYSVDSIQWDSYRRDDGRWIVTARLDGWPLGARANWTYDHAGRNLHALDDVAHRLMGVAPLEETEVDFITETPVAVIVEETEIEIIEEARPRLVAVPALEVQEPAADESSTLMLPLPVEEPVATAKRETKSVEKRPARPKGRRASIPTWDEILFGTSRNDDL